MKRATLTLGRLSPLALCWLAIAAALVAGQVGCVNREAGRLSVTLRDHLARVRKISRPASDKPANTATYEAAWDEAEGAAADLVKATGGGS